MSRPKVMSHIVSHKPKVKWSELMSTKACRLMQGHRMSEHGLQQEINRHAQDATPAQKKELYEKIYSTTE